MPHQLLITSSALLAAATFAGAQSPAAPAPTLWYDQPAKDWQSEALPLGNARLGAMTFGDPQHEHLQLNESSLWTGDEHDTGYYQNLADLAINLNHPPATAYRRELDLSTATHTIVYTANGVTYRRESFASHPAQVIVLRLTADRPGSYTGVIELKDAHTAVTAAGADALTAAGALSNGLLYETQILVKNTGGTLTADNNTLAFDHADALTLYINAGTNFAQNRARHWRGPNPHERISRQLAGASTQSFEQLHAAHVADYKSLFNRATLSLGQTPEAFKNIPTDQRLLAYTKGQQDPELESLVFQYGRYLMISSSRDFLPANLQGLWNDSNTPPWRSDYHTDVNVQMNYWLPDLANLSDCFPPLFDWVKAGLDVHREQTLAHFHARGWTSKGENGIFGGSSWEWVPAGSAWLCQNLWDHYAYTQDKAYLQKLYPVMKEVCEFWQDRLQALPDGTLVAPTDFSPEHGPHEQGVSFVQQLVWDLFTNTIDASKALDTDADFRNQLTALRAKLLPPKIGKWGQLQEWMIDRDDPKDNHRHVSHMVAVYPGRQISPETTPELAAAAAQSMTARGDLSTGWAMAWRINIWARLLDGNHAYKLLRNFIHLAGAKSMNYEGGGGLYSNLLCAHPPFQIDGNFGSAAGIAEMLVQSQNGTLDLLPALPDAWPEGSVTGLRARGGFTVDLTWQNHQLTRAVIHSTPGTNPTVRYQKKQTEIKLAAGQSTTFTP